MKELLLSLSFIILLSGCGENAIVNIYDKNITDGKIKCLRLDIQPPNSEVEKFMQTLYKGFDNSCPYRLSISYKGQIHCNATTNVARKVNSNFPSAYLRMDIYQGIKAEYSYYIDLTSPPTRSDLERGFDRIKKDLSLSM